MALRESLNRNPIFVLGIVAVAVLFAGILAYRQFRNSSPKLENQAFYSVDDGKTWFLDDAMAIPPFDHNGQPAVRIYLYTCKGNNQPFVGYLERYTDSARKQLLDVREKAKAQASREKALLVAVQAMGIQQSGVEYKKPGDKEWSKTRITVGCPGGRPDDLERVIPGQ